MSKEQTQDSMKAEEGVYLIFKNYTKSTNEIFDYSSIENNDIQNTFITEKTFIFKSENNIIKEFKDKELASEDDNLLLTIMRNEKGFYINNSNFHFQQIEQLRNVKNCLWYVINSDNKEIINPNEDYYLREGDIIKIGMVKYIIKKIFIKGYNKEEKEIKENNEKDGEKIYSLENKEFNELKQWIEDRKVIKEKKNKPVTNYYFNLYYCDECIAKYPNCINSECKFEKCYTNFPFKFKYHEKYKKEEINNLNFYPISIPENSNYMVLESLDYIDEYKNSSKVIKAIHIIKLTGEDINIGRDDKNDIIVNHSSASRNHAVIKYNDGKLLLKNKSKLSGTLVLIQNKIFDFSKKEVYLQVDNTFISAKIMKKDEFLAKMNEETVYPLVNEGKRDEENSNKIEKNNDIKKIIFQEISDNNISKKQPEPSYGAKFYDVKY
jgi:hypothetical protein